MKLLVIIALFFPPMIFGGTLESIVEGGKSRSNLMQSLKIIAELSPDLVYRNSRFRLTIYGRIDDGSHIYSIDHQGDFAPEPTRLVIESKSIVKCSNTQESAVKNIFDEAFNIPLKVHKDEFRLNQNCVVNRNAQNGIHEIRGYLQYQICDNRICSLPLKIKFQESLQIVE